MRDTLTYCIEAFLAAFLVGFIRYHGLHGLLGLLNEKGVL